MRYLAIRAPLEGFYAPHHEYRIWVPTEQFELSWQVPLRKVQREIRLYSERNTYQCVDSLELFLGPRYYDDHSTIGKYARLKWAERDHTQWFREILRHHFPELVGRDIMPRVVLPQRMDRKELWIEARRPRLDI